jgi:glycine cleavage system H protein
MPRHLRYTSDRERLLVEEGIATVGITAFAAKGGVVHLRLLGIGTWGEAGESCGEIESLTSVSGLPASASGEVLEADTAPADDPGVVNTAPCTVEWLFRPRVENLVGALSADACAAHRAHTEGDRR